MNKSNFGLTHIALAVRDLDRSSNFYAAALGAREYYRDDEMVMMTGPGEHDILGLELAPGKAGVEGGIRHFGFRLTAPEARDGLVDLLVAAGGELIERAVFDDGSPFARVNDPDGYTIEIWYESTPPHAPNR